MLMMSTVTSLSLKVGSVRHGFPDLLPIGKNYERWETGRGVDMYQLPYPYYSYLGKGVGQVG